MADYALTMEELRSTGCFDPPPALSAAVCNAEGLALDGQGEMQAWLKRAVNAGQTQEFLRAG
ncbi:H-NS histone family protein [Cupriavidus consociatus]|uniref:H-NS histone family protein n=1 Tax=Cupriavidus consociatus TaxID=2821357 RepID=UPI001AE7E6D2|nr:MULTISPECIES: H-NS histone family protein [unclassified Cupriavidus]MBP0624814.1 H-NS histone family protein [Cupriavidus sp. LEh25]MDK2661538.1 H-NS histone family protein [Cupriavidus sp. LEh21]